MNLTCTFTRPTAAPLSELAERIKARTKTRRVVVRLVLALALLLGAGGAFAIPLDEYRSRVHKGMTELDELLESEDRYSHPGFDTRATAVLEKLKALIPSDETVEWEGGWVRVNNSWLAEEIRNYHEMPSGDKRRVEAVVRITQRMGALENRLYELNGQSANTSAGKGEEKARLEAILRREEYLAKPPEKSLWERFWEWVASLFPNRNPLSPGQSSWLSSIAMILVFGSAAALLGYAIWKFAPFFARRRSSNRKQETRKPRFVLGEQLAAHETAADLLEQAEALAGRGELRAAIRKGYIALLCELGDRKVLTLERHKTNHDYLRAVRAKRPLLKDMQKLTNSFENHWYGFEPATANDWTAFRAGYQQTLKTASLLGDT